MPLVDLPEAARREIVFNSRSPKAMTITPTFYTTEGTIVTTDPLKIASEEFRAEGFGHILEDPITGKDDWQVDFGEMPELKGKRGVINFHSSSTAISTRGTPYNPW